MKKIANTIMMAAGLAATGVFFPLSAVADPWFDAGIPSYTSWPDDDSAYEVPGVGVWTNTASAELGSSAGQSWLSVFAEEVTPLLFTPLQTRSIMSDEPTMVFNVKFTEGTFPLVTDQTIKGSVTVVEKGEDSVYMGIMKDPDGATNIWRELSGATPDLANSVELRVSLRNYNGERQVRYAVGNTVLTSSYGEWAPTAYAGSSDDVTSAGMVGNGDLFNLAAETVVVRVKSPLTIPDIDGMGVVSVKVDGVEVSPEGDGTYLVPAGAYVAVTFAPDEGKYLDFRTMVFQMGDSAMTLPVAGRPSVVPPSSFLFINEVMASNGETAATVNGGAELDWVELRNDNDDDIDVTGWYMYDDATKPNKWVQIEGSCVVPGHGYKLVWCDKSYTNWAAGEAHAKFGVGKSDSTVVLASSNSVDAIVATLALPPQMKDVSYGRGNREKTILGKLDAAQWRVGDGEWQAASGPVGMPGAATGGFTVTSYQLNKDACANIPTVEGALASGRYSPQTTLSGVQTVAYKNASATVSSEFSSSYRSVSEVGMADNSTYYAILVEGVVNIPRAGSWTFSVGSDDGFSLEAWNEKYHFQSEYTGARGYGQTPAIFRVQEPGAYNVRLLYFQATGGAALDFCVKEGEFEDYENFTLDGFSLVGTAASGVTHAGAWAGHVSTDVSAAMLNVTNELEWKATFALDAAPASDDAFRLKVRFADGFTAKVNGTVVTNALVEEARALADALTPVVIPIPSGLLTVGDNLLEITAVNDAVGDPDFLLSAEVSVTKSAEELVFFREPTPGTKNTTAGYGPASPKVQFSVPHGYKTEAFDLTLSCADDPTATIYYTIDGTSPTTSSTPYTGPIHIASTTCIRAAVPQEGSVIQQDAAATYLFLDDILQQTSGVVPAGFPSTTINSQVMRYGMNPSVVNGADRDRLLRGFTNSVSTISLVIDPHNLFDPVEGIYVNAKACDGREWERTTMVEQIDPTNDANGFSTAGGIRIRGAFSRNPQYPKHSLRLFFRNDYGDGPLEFPLFGDEGASKFKKVDLRTSQNYAWANGTDSTYKKDTFIHEVFARDTQRDMGELYTRSRYYNLFINGHYWGLYQTQERGDEDYAETYNGGDADLYDVIKTSQPGYVTGASEGTIDAWEALWNMAVNEGFSGAYSNNYRKAMGQNPDGSRNPEYPVYLNPTNLMDYVINFHYMVDYDSPAASSKANNLYAVRDRDDNDDGLKSQGFYFLRHDAEHTMGKHANSEARDDPTLYGTEMTHANFKKLDAFNPAELHYKLCANPEYKMAFADRFYKHCLAQGGALTVPEATKRFQSRMAEIDDVIVCESARWATAGQTRQTWLSACGDCFTFITNRMPYMLSQYRNRGWYPSIDAGVVLNGTGATVVDGMVVASTDKIYLSGAGTVYYTLDGSDPRVEGGAIAGGAVQYSGAAPAPIDVPVIAKGDVWKYSDAGAKPAENWTAADYDDSSWSSGASRLGFASSGTFVTTLNRYVGGGSSGTQVTTYYFRKTFTMPAGAELVTELKAALDCDDGYVAYINGVEVKRDQVASTEYSAFSTATNMGEKNDVFTFPAGTLVEGENVIAVEVHQCNASSTDAWWNLALSYAQAVDVEGGLAVPPEGLTLTMRVLSQSGEWSALSTVNVRGELPQASVADGLRLAEALTSAVGGDDTLDYLVVTNVAAGEIHLGGVKIVAWNAKKNTEAKPSLTYFFPAGTSLGSGESLRIDAASFPAGGKLTNSQVGLRIYDAVGTLVQDVYLDAGWWNGACDETGEHFIAKTFGAEAKTHSDWKPSATAFSANVRVLELYTSTTGDGGDTGEFIVLTNLDASAALDLTDVKIVAWNSKKKSEADPSLVITLDGVTIPAGGTITLDQATYFGTGKLTNSKVGLKIYDPAEACAQEVEVDASWWSSACDGTGEYFVALEFGPTVKTVSQWTHKASAPTDWPDDPDTEITETTTAADLAITAGAFTNATPAELRKLSKWAKANGVPYGGEAVNGVAFAESGYTLFEEAYLLNCAPTAEAVAEKKALFRFNEIIPGTVPSIDATLYNGRVRILGSQTLEGGGTWSDASEDLATAHFFKAVLTR